MTTIVWAIQRGSANIIQKYRQKILYGEHKAENGKILRELWDWKGIRRVEAEVCPEHIHMLVEIPPKESVEGFMGLLKGKSSIQIQERHGNLKYKYGNRSFWCRGYHGHSRKEHEKDSGVYSESAQRKRTSGPTD